MNLDGNLSTYILRQTNVGGIVALPPTSCLRAARPSACPAAHVGRTGSARRRHSRQIGPLRRKGVICPRERF